MSALKYWVWLTTLPGLTGTARQALLERFLSPEEIYYAPQEQILQIEGVLPRQAECLENKSLDRANSILEECARKEIFLLTQQDALYPQRLLNIYDPPMLLYGKGAMPMFDEEVTVAMVGTRNCTPYGVRNARRLAYDLTKQGALVISGLARGIDTQAHCGAMQAGGLTAAVVGCGVDVVYPEENRRVYEDMLLSGVILSEYPPGTEPAGWHFPARNRIISGLSLATVVIEAPEKSGALITAATALEQGRDVFALPGAVDAENCVGCNRLIRDDAGLVTESWDILQEYRNRYPHKLHRNAEKLPPMPAQHEQRQGEKEVAPPAKELRRISAEQEGLTEDQICILQSLDGEKSMLADDLAEQTERSVQRVMSALTLLEIQGFVRREGLHRFLRTVEIEKTKE